MSETPPWMVHYGMDKEIPVAYAPRPKNDRFFMKSGQKRNVIFLTDGSDCPCIWEHEIFVDGRYQTVTCLKSEEGQNCPLCQWAEKNNKGRRYAATFFTILDTTEWEDKQGKKHSNNKRMLVAKKDTVAKLKRKKERLEEQGHSLKGAMYEVFRTNSDKSPRVGDEYEFVKMVNIEEYAKKHSCDVSPYDYYELLKPNPDRVREIINKISGSDLPRPDEIPI